MIETTEESGESRIYMRLYLGLAWENGRAERVLVTPAPQAHSDLTGRTHRHMLPWLRPLRTVRNAVQFATELVYA